MKKKTNIQTSDEGEAKSKRERRPPRETSRGPQKEKTQITIRVDQALMNAAYAQMKEDNIRVTDIVERGLQLALEEARHEMPAWTKQVRFMVANTTRDQQELIRGLLIAMVEPGVLEARHQMMLPEEVKFFEMCAWFLNSRNTVPHADLCLQYYSRYGKSPEEVAQLDKKLAARRR